MTKSTARRFLFDVLPALILIAYGLIDPKTSLLSLPVGMILLIWAGYRLGSANLQTPKRTEDVANTLDTVDQKSHSQIS